MSSWINRAGGLALAASIVLITGATVLARQADMALRAASWLDVEKGVTYGPSMILIKANRVTAIVGLNAFHESDAAQMIALGTATVLPGLIDAHVHVQI